MKQYLNGHVETRKNRATGTTISLHHGEQSGIDVDQPWVTLCEDHGMVIGHQTLRAARSWMAEPQTWCDVCRQQYETKNPSSEKTDVLQPPSRDTDGINVQDHPHSQTKGGEMH